MHSTSYYKRVKFSFWVSVEVAGVVVLVEV